MKLSISKLSLSISYFSALLAVTLFAFLKIPLMPIYLAFDLQKNYIILFLAFISCLFYIFYLIKRKEIKLFDNNLINIFTVIFPIIILISSISSFIFSRNINSFLGKDLSIQNFVSYLALSYFVFIISTNFKKFRSPTWIILALSTILITLSSLIGIILYKSGLNNLANMFVLFVDNWDIVAVSAGIVSVLSLVYYEAIAYSKKQKIISLSLLILHLILVSFIVIPDIWYALTLSSLFILIISEFNNKLNIKKIFKKASFWVFLISLIFSILFTLQYKVTQKITSKIGDFYNKNVGVSYNFVKPKLGLSLDMGITELKKGKIFGAGPSDFNNSWIKNRPTSVITSDYWNIGFTSSFSAFTTLFVTIGIVGSLYFIFILIGLIKSIFSKLKNKKGDSYNDLDGEEKFYFLLSVTLFIFSLSLFFVFSNMTISLILLALSIAILLGQIEKNKIQKLNKKYLLIILIILAIIIYGLFVSSKRFLSYNTTNKAIESYKSDNDILKLEKSLTKAAKLSNDDNDYRTLTQFYLYKTQQILNTKYEDNQQLQNDLINSINSAINSSKKAVQLDNKNYNNYISLGSVYSFLLTLDKQNKDAYYQNAKDAFNKALSLNPKDPTIPLTLAQLDYSYGQNTNSVLENIKNSLNIKPNYSAAYYALSQLSSQNNDTDSAIKYAALAIQSDQKNVNAYIQYSILILNKKTISRDELNNVYTALVTSLNLEPNNITAAYYLAITYTFANDFEKAQNIVDNLKKAIPNSDKIIELQNFINSKKGTTSQITASSTVKK